MIDREEIEELRGTFRDGYTPEDADLVLDMMSEWTGLDLFIEWAFEDCYGAGGDSQLRSVQGGKMYHVPVDLWHFLIGEDYDCPGDADSLRGIVVEGRGDELPPVEVTNRNRAWKFYRGEAPAAGRCL